MTPTSIFERVSPLAPGASARAPVRAPRIAFRPELAPVSTISNATFMRAWAARRAARTRSTRAML